MKYLVVFLSLLISCQVLSQVTFSPADLEIIAKGDQNAFARNQFRKTLAAISGYDVKWYRCYWNIDPAIDSISGSVTMLFTPVQTPLDSLVLDLSQALTVDSVLWHHNSISFLHSSDRVILHFPASALRPLTSNLQPPPSALRLPPSDLRPPTSDLTSSPDSVSIYYHGVPPATGFGSFVKSTHNGSPIIWTLSEPYGASEWWPCKNGLSDKADSIDIYIRAPSAYRSASNGILVSETIEGPNTVFHWKHRYPIATYLVCLAVTNYSRYTQRVPFGTDTLNVVNYIYPEDSVSASTQTPVIGSMIQLYDTLFGIYPFQREKYGQAEFGWGGGMEHQTITFVTNFGFELQAHELAHHWFGDKVTCGSWTDVWLNEGFATYLSGLCYEHLSPIYWQRFREVRVQSIVSQPGGSVYCTDTTDVSRIFSSRLSYAKGAMILHQLRWILGDSAFFTALNQYLADPAVAYGFARTADFKAHLESSSGQDLTWYFDDWFTGEGFPSYLINWSQAGDTVSFTVKQTQSSPTVSFFPMSIPLKFKNQERDTLLRFSNTFSGQSFTVLIPFKVDSLVFDPEVNLISGNNQINAVGEHPGQQSVLQVYPNPTKDRITFSFGEYLLNSSAKISIFDPLGHLVKELQVNKGAAEITVDSRDFSPGLYFYVFTLKGIRETGKFEIIR